MKKGDRVRLSQKALDEWWRVVQKTGTIITVRKRTDGSERVKWDSQKDPTTIHRSFLEVIREEDQT